MSQHPVVVYGASGYTGRLVCEYLRDHYVGFTAAGRDQARVQSVMDSNVPGIETAVYESVGVEHTLEALTELFRGSKVVCNTVGPFADLGMVVVEAALAAGCHYLDTTGEQNWHLMLEEEMAGKYAEAGLVLVPGLAHMYTTGEIAAQIALEEPGLDSLDILVLWKGAPTTASTETILTNLMSTAYALENNEYVEIEGVTAYEAVVPGQHRTALTLVWGGTGHPVWFKHDPRVANVTVSGGVFDRALMEQVHGVAQMVVNDIKPLPEEQQGPAIAQVAEAMKAPMPPRENPRYNRSIDSVHASGPLKDVHVVILGNQNYKQTGLLQAHAAFHLLNAPPYKVGSASGCQAFGHRELLGKLQAYGLIGEPSVTITGV